MAKFGLTILYPYPANRELPGSPETPRNYALAALFQQGGLVMEAYCLKCREKREIVNQEQVTLKNGRPATKGDCPTCGTKVFRIGKA